MRVCACMCMCMCVGVVCMCACVVCVCECVDDAQARWFQRQLKFNCPHAGFWSSANIHSFSVIKRPLSHSKGEKKLFTGMSFYPSEEK